MSYYIMILFSLFIICIIRIVKRLVRINEIYTISINQQKEIKVKGGEYLSKALFHHNIFIPSACGGKGTCSACKINILYPNEPLLTDQAALSRNEIDKGYRLGCQTKVRKNLTITIPEELYSVKRFTGCVKDLKVLTSDIKRISLNITTPLEGIRFKNGQYILILLKDGDERAYSIASSNEIFNSIDIEVKKVSHSGASAYLHELKIGDKIDFLGPFGDFCLQNSGYDILCIAGGVGIAPIKPIIEEALKKYSQKRIMLFYGAKYIEDLYDHEYFRELGKKYIHFQYIPVLSREKNRNDLENVTYGAIGHMVDKQVEVNAPFEVYLCGPPGMVESVMTLLSNKNIPRSRILYDKF